MSESPHYLASKSRVRSSAFRRHFREHCNLPPEGGTTKRYRTLPPEGGTTKRLRNGAGDSAQLDVPLLAVVKDWVLTPDSSCLFVSYLVKELLRARPKPVLPFVDVAMLDGIVMYVIHTCPEVTL